MKRKKTMKKCSEIKPHLFGTDGIRGKYGEGLTREMAYRLGRYIGFNQSGKRNYIVIGRDTRFSGSLLLSALVEGITKSGSNVYDLGVTTTPSVSYLINKRKYTYGIMISASHNPYTDNGIKVFSNTGSKISEDLEVEIERYIEKENDDLEIKKFSHAGKLVPSTNVKNEYIDFLKSYLNSDLEGLNLLLDLANGSATAIAPKLFSSLKANVTLFNDKPDGKNINLNAGSTHLEGIISRMKEGHYDLGFAFDGDADRLMCINHNGEIIDGDKILFILAKALKEQNKLSGNAIVVTKMSNIGLLKALDEENIEVIITDVGDKYVQRSLKEHGYILGGEQSGHIIQYDKLETGDGFLTMVALLNEYVRLGNSFDEILKGITIYPQLMLNYRLKDKDSNVLEKEKVISFIKENENLLNGEGRIFVRKSGTEPLIRIMCEAKTLELCEKITKSIYQIIESEE